MKRSKRKKKEIGVFVDGVLIGVLAKDQLTIPEKDKEWINKGLGKSHKGRAKFGRFTKL